MRIKILYVLIALFTTAITTNAQNKNVVISFKQTTDHIPVSDRRNDLNQTPCALVKVQVVDDIDRVEGNKIGDIVNRGVEKWVYLCKGSRNIRIHFKNHLPIRIDFKDYQINGLESNRVYEATIDFRDGSQPDPQPKPQPVQQEQSKPQPVQQEQSKSQPVQQEQPHSIIIKKPLNIKSYKFSYKNVTFKCKVENNRITIKEFDTWASDVTIPAEITIEGIVCSVVEVSTHINGNNYSATKLTIEEGVEKIDKFSFAEFRKLQEVILPHSITEIGKNAFRDNKSTMFYLPGTIKESDIRNGRTIKIIR